MKGSTADVVVENFRAGVIEDLGFGYEAIRAIRPDVVYCSISGYGQTGPMQGAAAYDGAIQAASGMMSVNGHPETGPTRAPSRDTSMRLTSWDRPPISNRTEAELAKRSLSRCSALRVASWTIAGI